MNMVHISNILSGHKLFHHFSKEEIALLSQHSEVLNLDQGFYIMNEGEQAKTVFLIEEGSAEVVKKNDETKEAYVLGVLGKGDCAGEMSLLSGAARRSASVRVSEKSKVIKIDFSLILQDKENEAMYIKLLSNISRDLSNKLSATNQLALSTMQKELEVSKARIAMGMFTVNLLLILSIYTLSFRLLVDMVVEWGSAWISLGILSILAAIMYVLIVRSGYPLHKFGLTLTNWKRVLLDSFVWTVPLLVGIAAAKWVILLIHPEINDSVFRIIPMITGGGIDTRFLIYGIAYALFCPIQEFISRSGIQSALQNFLPSSKGRVWIAILLSNLLFAMAHTHVNLTFALLTLVPGFFWGWMYARQHSLLGAAFSHVLVGVWIFFIVGIDQIWIALF